MIGNIPIMLYIILAIITFVVQQILYKKSEKKVVHLIPLFTMITALMVAFIMSLLDVRGESVKCGTLMPTVRVIKDAVTVCMTTDAIAVVINKIKTNKE